MSRLKDKVAIITGGAGGIGQAAGKLFVEEGAKVLLVDLDESALSETVKAISSDSVTYFTADVTQRADTQSYVKAAVERYGGIDICLCNAGIEGEVNPITDYDEDTFDRVMAVNVKGVWLGLKYVIPEMKKRNGGSIVITSSIAGVKGSPGIAPYSTSKHAIVGLMRSAARECASMGIRVNSVNPAPIETRMMRSLESQSTTLEPEEVKEQYRSNIPLGRYGSPMEVAQTMLFLASDDSQFCTGGIYMVDGGLSAR